MNPANLAFGLFSPLQELHGTYKSPPPPPAFRVIINNHPQYTLKFDSYHDDGRTEYVQGRQMLLNSRCSEIVKDYLDVDFCRKKPFGANPSCYQDDLDLRSDPDSRNFPSTHWLPILNAPPLAPPPLAPFEPPPLKPPPPPPPPPMPPRRWTQDELLTQVRMYEEEACSSVYWLSTRARCDRLASELSERVLYTLKPPPSPPPARPLIVSPSPPTPPPRPRWPHSIRQLSYTKPRLSTIRIPEQRNLTSENSNDFNDGFYVHSHVDLKENMIQNRNITHSRVSCDEGNELGLLPCVTGALETECLSDRKRCGSDYQNSLNPFIEVTIVREPYIQQSRLWGIEMHLPQDEERANLFYSSSEKDGGSGYQVHVFAPDGSHIKCNTQREQRMASGIPTSRILLHLCASANTNNDKLYSLQYAKRIRISLPGAYRQLWLQSVNLLEITMPPDLLPAPPHAYTSHTHTPPTTHNCSDFIHRHYYQDRKVVSEDQCSLSRNECFHHMKEQGAPAFELDDAGCCTLVSSQTGYLVNMKRTEIWDWNHMTSLSGTGYVKKNC